MNAATGLMYELHFPIAPQSAKVTLFAVGQILIAASIAMLLGAQAPADVTATAALSKATHLWHGTVHAQSSYASQESDGSPGKHAWTRDYRIVLAEIPTTSSHGVLVDGNWVSWPINDLVPVLLEYKIDAFTDDRPYVRGPAHGGHVATGAVSGTLSQSQLIEFVPDAFTRIGGTWGSLNRLVAPAAPLALPSSWTEQTDYGDSLGKAMSAPGGYDIFISLRGSAPNAEELKALYSGITVTHMPCNIPEINVHEAAELQTAEGFLRCMTIVEMVHIFGGLEGPDQNQVSGSHFYNQHDPDPGYSPPQVLVTWDLKRIPYQPFIQIEYRQKQDRSFVGQLPWFRHNMFVDFLVGHKQAPIDVRIRTIPEDAAIQWSLAPEGNASGRIDPNQGTSKEFSFTPNVQGVRPTQGARQPNAPIKYTLTVHNETRTRQLARETICQDTISVMRQEYVDYRRQTRRRNVNFGLVPPARERFGVIAPLGVNFTLQDGHDAVYGNYLPQQMTLNGGWRVMALNTQRRYNGVIDLNSAYRNPQRNTVVNGAALSIHMTGGAVDMDMDPQDAAHMVALHRAALFSGGSEILLEIAGGGVTGGTLLVPKNWGPPPASHTFTVGNRTVTVEDSNGDDLPDRVSAIRDSRPNPVPPTPGAPPVGIPSGTLLPYAGGGETNPSFQIQDGNRNGRIDVGEPLLLRYPAGEFHSLRYYYDTATHVHCATAEMPRAQRP